MVFYQMAFAESSLWELHVRKLSGYLLEDTTTSLHIIYHLEIK